MIEGAGEGHNAPLLSTMDSEMIFVNLVNSISSSLEEIGLYAINHDAILTGERHRSYDDLREKIMNNQTQLRFDIDCFIGPTAWKDKEKDLTQFFLDMADINLEDLADYFKSEDG